MRPLVVISVLALVLAVVYFVAYYNSADNRAQRACHVYVEASLKAPSTADFSGEFAVEGDAEETWTVYGTVDSENGFGAKVRNEFTCDVSKVGGDFRVDDADFSEDDD